MKLPEEPDRLFLWPEPSKWRGRAIATSHQPDLFHAGIWVREFVLAELARQGWEATYFEADAASCQVEAVVPAYGPLRVERVPLATGSLERLPAPTRSEWEAFLRRAGVESAWLEAPNLARFLAGLRHLAAPHQLPRRWQSEWSESPAFEQLVQPIREDPEGFRQVFNQVCSEVRARRRWRSRAHPFPELRRDGELVEVPLWRERRPVWADSRGRLWADGRPIEDRSQLRPRAMLWTAWCRLQCDLYLHGTGGAAYDEATDLILQRFFGLEPAPYAVAWLNYWLDLPADERAPARLAELTARLWQVRHNPQRFLPEHPLSREKQQLLLREPGKGRELKAINRILSQELQPLRESLEKQRTEALLAVGELAAARYRGYSWLVVDARRLQAISSRSFSSR